jgi:hypothetical protein
MKRIASTVSLVLCACIASSVIPLRIPSFTTAEESGKGGSNADKPLVVDLWPGMAPDETGDIGAEAIRMSPKLDKK